MTLTRVHFRKKSREKFFDANAAQQFQFCATRN